MKSSFLFIILTITLFACKNEKALTFADFVEVDRIEKVIMSNNSGKFTLLDQQLVDFKKQISSLKYEPSISVKVGAIHMLVVIDGKKYDIATATNGDYVEIDKHLVTKNKEAFKNSFFKTNGVNFDNFRNE